MAEHDEQRDELAKIEELEQELAEARAELAGVKREAEAASRSKSAFLANMSHEIRTPMTSVLGYVDMLIEDGSFSHAPSSCLQQLYAIKRSGRHLVHILGDILDFSRIEAGKLQIERISVSPIEIVEDVVSVVRPTALGKKLGFEVQYVGRIPEQIETDPTRLRQVLLNLLGNAVKFTELGGIRFLIELLDQASSNPALQFSITDTGVGIPPAAAERLFQPFSQADSSNSRKFGGTGLGLVISRELAQLLGGDIQLETAEGWGSSFVVRIGVGSLQNTRLISPEEHRKASESEGVGTLRFLTAVEESGPAAHILVVDDCEDNRRITSHVLKKAGFQVSQATNGREAVKLALSARGADQFSVILMDMQMPVMDGYEATRTLRERGLCNTPIIALTAHAMTGEREKCLAAGCDEFETKPIDRRKLIEKVLSFLEKPSSLGGD